MCRFLYYSFVICILTCCIFCSSCSQHSGKAKILIDKAEAIMESHPDSALALLDSIKDPQDLSKKLFHKYYLLNVEAKDKNYLDIKDDSLILETANYFEGKKDIQNAALAYFYAERVKDQQGDMTSAIEQLLKAAQYAEEAQNYNLLGLIYFDLGQIYRKQKNYNKAIEKMILAKDYFKKANNNKNEIYILGRIGDLYLFMQPSHVDSAILYNNKVLNYARINKDTIEIQGALKAIAIAYLEVNDYKNAKSFIKQAIEIDKNQKFIFANNRTLAQTFIAANQADSAIYYMQKISPMIKQSDDIHIRLNYYFYLYKIYKGEKNYSRALEYFETASDLSDSIRIKNKNEDLETINQKYEKSQLENQYIRTRIQQQVLIIALFIALFVIMLLIWAIRLIYQKKDSKIREIEKTIITLENLQRDKDNKLKQYLVEKLDITRKIIYHQSVDITKSSEVISNYNDLFGTDLYTHLQWDELYSILNGVYNGFVDKMRKKFPAIEEKDLQICCLMKAELKNDEMAFFLGYKINSFNTIKSAIKDKLNFQTLDDLKNFIDSL